MAEIYRLPAVSPTMEIGTLESWRVAVGDAFESGTILAEIGTDKATMEAEVFDDGVVLALLVDEDDEVPVDAPIAVFGEAGEDAADLIAEARAELARLRASASGDAPAQDAVSDDTPADASGDTPEPPAPSSPVPVPDAGRSWHGKSLPDWVLDPPGDRGLAPTGPAAARKVQGAAGRGPVRASPAARKAAQEAGVDLAHVAGTGPHGRVTRADVEQHRPARGGAVVPVPPDETIKASPMRRTIASRLAEVHRNAPTFRLQVTFDMAATVALRAQLKAAFPDDRVSYNDLFLAAVGRALRATPEARTSWNADGKSMTRFGGCHVGMAVAVPDGLITPVIRDCDRLSVREIARTARALATKAREGTLAPVEYQGNTFTVSNLGMMGITRFDAILNPPAAAILAVGALEQRPVVEDGRLTVGWRMDVTMTCDHRSLDGAVGARFLQVLRGYVEQPATMAPMFS